MLRLRSRPESPTAKPRRTRSPRDLPQRPWAHSIRVRWGSIRNRLACGEPRARATRDCAGSNGALTPKAFHPDEIFSRNDARAFRGRVLTWPRCRFARLAVDALTGNDAWQDAARRTVRPKGLRPIGASATSITCW